MSEEQELPPVLDVLRRWLRAVYVDQDTAAALALTHPHAPMPPSSEYGPAVREKWPWLGDDDLSFSEPQEVAPDLDAVVVMRTDTPMARILVFRRFQPTSDEPESPVVFAVVTPDGWGLDAESA